MDKYQTLMTELQFLLERWEREAQNWCPLTDIPDPTSDTMRHFILQRIEELRKLVER